MTSVSFGEIKSSTSPWQGQLNKRGRKNQEPMAILKVPGNPGKQSPAPQPLEHKLWPRTALRVMICRRETSTYAYKDNYPDIQPSLPRNLGVLGSAQPLPLKVRDIPMAVWFKAVMKTCR
ncbi:MAG: hypothetical protein D4R73_10645 [Deltaproteobacteria bacterium]|nr:MAG: hypothetical protein D4R73_10645 [Deltaproteobacteria bacterium]